MSIILIDGFDMYNGTGVGTGIQSLWSIGGGISLAAGRFGGQAVNINPGNANSTSMYRQLSSAPTTIAFGCACFFPAINASPGSFGNWQLRLGGTYQCGVRVNGNGGLDGTRMTGDTTGTVLGSSANGVFAPNVWHFIEIEFVISTTVGRITVYLDSVQVLNLTGINTANAGVGTGADRVAFGLYSSQNGTIAFDDLYITNVATKLGECRVETLRPNADTAVKAFTPNSGTANFSRVNETLVDGDTSYVQASAVGNRDLYTLPSLSSTPAQIFAANIVSFAEKTDATSRSIYNSVRSNSVDSDGAAMTLLSSYFRNDRVMELDPDGNVAWTPAKINALQIGPKVAS